MKILKKIFTFLLSFGFGFNLFAQNVGVLNGPSGIPCAFLIENNSEMNFDFFANAQEELAKLIKGEIDIGFLPPNVAAKVYTKNNGKLLCLGITGNGNIFAISKSEIKSLADLKGKTVYCAGQGATPEYMTRFLLEKNNVSDVTLDFSIPNPQLAPSVISGKAEIAIVPEPFSTVAEIKNPSIKRVIDFQAEFSKIEKSTYPITVLVANADYVKSNKKEVKTFLKKIENAIDFTVKNPAETGKLVEKHQMGLSAEVVEKSIPNGNYVWISAKKGREQIENLLKIFLENDPESVGGKLPEKGFYY